MHGIFESREFAHLKSIDLNGTNEAYQNTTDNDVGIGNVFTIAFWAQSGGTGASDRYITINQVSGNNNKITISKRGDLANDPLQVLLQNNASGTLFKDYRYNSVVGTGVMRHIVITWDGTSLLAYVDGTLTAASSTPTDNAGTMANTNRQVGIAIEPGGGNQWLGIFHSAAIWDVALDQTNVTAIYNNGNGGRFNLKDVSNGYSMPHRLKHWWIFGGTLNGITDLNSIDLVDVGGISVETNKTNITDADASSTFPGV